MDTQAALPLPAPAASNTVFINARCSLRVEGEQRVIVVAGLPVHHYGAEDAIAQAYAMVFLVESGFAEQTEVARAFARSERTVRRYRARYEQGGMAGLSREAGWRRGRRRLSGRRLRSIERLHSQGLSNRAIAQRLGVNEKAIRKVVGPSQSAEPSERAQLALVATTPVAQRTSPQTALARAKSNTEDRDPQPPLPADEQAANLNEADAGEPVPMSLDHDASDRRFDRQLAYLGLLDDAAPLFRDGDQIPGAGVLLALPCVLESGVLRIARKL